MSPNATTTIMAAKFFTLFLIKFILFPFCSFSFFANQCLRIDGHTHAPQRVGMWNQKRFLEGNIGRTAHARRPSFELPTGSLGRTYVRNEGLRRVGGRFQRKLPHWRND